MQGEQQRHGNCRDQRERELADRAAEGVTLSSWYPVRVPPAPADVTITATTQSLAALIFTGSDAVIDITGETGAAERFRRLISTMAAVVQAERVDHTA